MARQKGTANLAASLEVLAGAPLDSRTVVPTVADLTVAANFPYKYIGMPVVVQATGDMYVLTANDVTVSANWKKVNGSGGSGGHTIKDDGTAMTARAGLNFTDFDVSDDSTNDETDVKAHRLTQEEMADIIYKIPSGGIGTAAVRDITLLYGSDDNDTTWTGTGDVSLTDSFLNYEFLAIYFCMQGRTTGHIFNTHHGEIDLVIYPSKLLEKCMNNDNMLVKTTSSRYNQFYVVDEQTINFSTGGNEKIGVNKIYGLNKTSGAGDIIYDETGDPHQIGKYVDSNGVSSPIYRRLAVTDITEPHLISDGTPYVSSGGTSLPATNLFDGNTNTYWNPDPSAGSVPCYAGKSGVTAFSNFEKARVYMKTRGSDQEDYWVIQGSSDGENWTEISERKSSISSGWNEFNAVAYTGEFTNIRLYISNTIIPSTSGGRYSQIGEIEFYLSGLEYSKIIDKKKTYDDQYYMIDYTA